jgi:hypothetical protein
MTDVWFAELRKAQQLTKSVDEALTASGARSPSAREAASFRGKLRQANAVAAQLEQSLAAISDKVDSARRATLVIELFATVRSLHKRLDGDGENEVDERLSFDDRIQRQNNGLDKLHTSIVGLKEVGSEISAEIEAQTRLLSDIDGRAGGMDLEQQKLYSKYQAMNATASSTCTLYVLIIILIFLVITTVANL